MHYSDPFLKDILTRTRKIAVVGVSANPARPSHSVAQYLSLKGYELYPINPGLAGQELFGRPVLADLSDCPSDIDMVDVFRRPEHVPDIVDAALGAFPKLGTFWMQLGVVHEAAAEVARARGVDVVMDRCPKIEYPRLFG